MRIFIASANKGKIAEIKEIFKDYDLEFISILDSEKLEKLGIKIPIGFDVEETGKDFKDNAFLKAEAYAKLTNLPVIADDSGLEIEVLDNFPGVNSNRWYEGSAEERNQATLDLLKDKDNRNARFTSVLCYFDPKTDEEQFFRGEVRGKIADSPKGSKNVGFGYDPIFIPDGFEKSFSELGVEVKNKISHRKKVLEQFFQFLEKESKLK